MDGFWFKGLTTNLPAGRQGHEEGTQGAEKKGQFDYSGFRNTGCCFKMTQYFLIFLYWLLDFVCKFRF